MKLARQLVHAVVLGMLFLVPVALASSLAAGLADVDELKQELLTLRDDADPELVSQLADIGSREAAEALIEVYDSVGSIFMQREIMRALARMDDYPEAGDIAVEKVASIATGASDSELREWAIESLAGCRRHGKPLLVMIVESNAEDSVRESAMQAHLELAESSDATWYRELWKPKAEPKKKKKKSKDEEPPTTAPPTLIIRRLAFEGLRPTLEVDELVESTEHIDPETRSGALEELAQRGEDQAWELAEERYGRADENSGVRATAAGVLARRADSKLFAQFMTDGLKSNTPRELSYALADILAEEGDDDLKKKLLKKAGKGNEAAQLFVLRALADMHDEKLVKATLKGLSNKSVEVRLASAQYFERHADEAAVEALDSMVEKYDDALTVSAGMRALNAIHGDDPAWRAQLVAFLDDEDTVVRNAALNALAETGDKQYLALFVERLEHPDWSTRLAAARALGSLRAPEGVPPLIARVDVEVGLMRTRIIEVLFKLTGKTFGPRATAWESWWKREGADFEPISAAELRKIEAEEEQRRLRQITRTSFFGIKIESRRVIFILDVSGSMNELTRGRYVGKPGAPRIDVAKEQLLEALEGLESGTLFNIVSFSGGVGPWLDESITASEGADLDEAKEWVSRLGAGGGTNLYGALQYAFEDPDVDSIYVLSDGEPSVGDVIDPAVIREHVELWNENRGIVVHTIAVGGQFRILEWLAEDHGGKHVRFY